MRSFVSLIILALIFSCQNPKKSTPDKKPFFKMSLAQWSFNKSFRSGDVSPYEFARLASELGFEGLEYVNQLYPDVMDSEDKTTAIAAFVEKKAICCRNLWKIVGMSWDSVGNLVGSALRVVTGKGGVPAKCCFGLQIFFTKPS